MSTQKPTLLTPAQLDWTAGGQPYSKSFADIYFNPEHGITESQHVFLQPNQLPQRFAQAPLDQAFIIAELGFGSGLNCLLTWQACATALNNRRPLVYQAIEKHPLTLTDLQRVLNNNLWPPHLTPFSERLLACYPPLIAGCHSLPLVPGQFILQLWLGEIAEQLAHWEHADISGVDCWFLDGFAPAKNPAMWTTNIYQQMSRLSRPQATFSTFTAAGHVRRGLQAAGFIVEKSAGFATKREMLRGYWPGQKTPAPTQAPWLTRSVERVSQRHALIIGAGLAGCHCAYSLSQQGWTSTVLEQQNTLAAAASGNRQGVLYPLLNRAWHDVPLQISLSGFLLAQQIAQQLQQAGHHFAHAICGMLQCALNSADEIRLQHIATHLPLPKTFMQWYSAAQIQTRWDFSTAFGGLYLPSAGWLSPPQYCAALMQAAADSSTVLYGQHVAQLQQVATGWQALAADGACLAHAPVVIIANAHAATQLLPHLPLTPLRGQVSYPAATAASQRLNTVFCHEGYVTPALDGVHCVGASYELNSTDCAIRAVDNVDNAARVRRLSPTLADKFVITAETPARAGIRCVTPDHLPLAGAVPDYESFMTTYADLAHGRAYRHYPTPSTTGLYLSVGHGSRGLLFAPLAAQLISAQLTRQPAPLPLHLLQALAPQRFWVRQLKRQAR